MKLVEEYGNEKLALASEKEKEIDDEQFLIVGTSGLGKTLLLERVIYNYWKNGYQIIIATDQKDLMELGFMCFPSTIMKKYHLDALKFERQQPVQVPIKILHPFTFDAPLSQKMPETHFFSFPITAMGDSEFNLLLETQEDKSTREMLIESVNNLKRDEGLWHFIQRLEQLTERDTQQIGSYEIRKPNKDLFFIKSPAIGNLKNIDEIARIFNRFQRHFFLQAESCKYNLDWKKEVFDTDAIKIFTTRYIKKDRKCKDFFTLLLINQLIENYHYAKKGILCVFDEVKDLCSVDSTVPYSQVLASEMARFFNTKFRSRKISSVSSSQSFAGLSKKLTKSNAFTKSFIMQITGEADISSLRQIYGFDNEDISLGVLDLGKNQFFIRGLSGTSIEDCVGNPFRALMPPFPHCEAGYVFDKFYAQHFPDKMKVYLDLKKDIQQLKESYINYFSIKTGEEYRRNLEKLQESRESKEKLKEMESKLKEIKEKELTEKQSRVNERNQKIWIDYADNKLSQSDLAKKYGISQPMINKILRKMKDSRKDISNYNGKRGDNKNAI